MHRRQTFDSIQLTRRAEDLIKSSANRYRVTVQVAHRAKRRRYEDYDTFDSGVKPVIRTILEMSEELNQPEIIGDLQLNA